MAQQGGCHCGKVRYSIEGEPAKKALCHCLDCRKISGSVYSVNAVYPDSGFKVTQGTPKEFAVKGDTGNTITSSFCGDCGSTLFRTGGAFPSLVIIKVGTLDDPKQLNDYKPSAELYASTRAPWVPAVEGAEQKEAM